ncbi:MAG: acyl-ACP desaturase [Candidatus Levybacteria bacterium]|nr:acyl-ACP desaturase [Candidatus Levybacteria bacterium]MSU26035.1 hypothetical protein [Candidatus Levybacteria bacterium]
MKEKQNIGNIFNAESRASSSESISPITTTDQIRPVPEFQIIKPLDDESRIIAQHDEVLKSMEQFTLRLIEKISIDPANQSEPSSFFPDSRQEDEFWFQDIKNLREETKRLSDPTLVALIGNYITEEGLPMFTTWIDRIHAFKDDTGTDQGAWPTWNRIWTADEYGHGKTIGRWLEPNPKINMIMVDKSIRRYHINGFNPEIDKDGYKVLGYTSIQEDATGDAHMEVAIRAEKSGAPTLARGLRAIVKDERRHHAFYSGNMAEVFRINPENAVIAIAKLMRKGIVMPAARMDDLGLFSGDKRQSDIYRDYELVSQVEGLYTVEGYERNFNKVMREWKVADISVSGESAKAQDYLLNKVPRMIQRYISSMESRIKEEPTLYFSWIDNRPIKIKKQE